MKMPWIKSSLSWATDPRLTLLEHEMGWNRSETIGKWHIFLWWCFANREDGILEGFTSQQIARAFDIGFSEGERLVQVLLKAELFDKAPLRVSDWWELAGAYLISKYRNTNKEYVQKIAMKYDKGADRTPLVRPGELPKSAPASLSQSPSGSLSSSSLKSSNKGSGYLSNGRNDELD